MSRIVPSALWMFIICMSACQSHSSKNAGGDSTAERSGAPAFTPNPENRTTVKKEPVAQYRIRTDDKLNESYFSVTMYETQQTMRYRLQLEFEGVTGEDTVKLPDLGVPPEPAIEPGKEQYSCIVGLKDKDHQFRELKKVYVTDKGRSLKVTTLKHYVMTGGSQLQEE